MHSSDTDIVHGMQLAFRALEQLTIGRPELDGVTPVASVDDEGVSLRYGYWQSYRGEGQMEHETVPFTWEEIAQLARAESAIISSLEPRWKAARQSREQLEVELERRLKVEVERQLKEREEAAERRMAARYPDELTSSTEPSPTTRSPHPSHPCLPAPNAPSGPPTPPQSSSSMPVSRP